MTEVRSAVRGLRSRAAPLAAVAAMVGLAAGFAALVTTVWTVSLPLGARADVAGSAAGSVTVNRLMVSAQTYASSNTAVAAAVARDAPGVFAVGQTRLTELYVLPGGAGEQESGGPAAETYLVASSGIEAHTRLIAGRWPDAMGAGATQPTVGPVQVAVPAGAADQLGLKVGQTLSLAAPGAPAVAVQIVGEYRYLTSGPDVAALAWNVIGPAGVEFSASNGDLYGPLVAAPEAFTSGALTANSVTWTLTPLGAPGVGALQAAVDALAADPRLAASQGYTITDNALSAELSAVDARMTVERGELLAATLLLGLLAGLALAAAASGLVARGAAQAALARGRGAPAWRVVSGYLPDVALLLPAAALGVAVQGPLFGRPLLRIAPVTPQGGALGLGLPAADWIAGLCTAVLTGVVVLCSAARAVLPSKASADSGRQAAASPLALAGVDVALVVLAAAALWQAGATGLTSRLASGGTGVVLIVACAPALAAAAGAAVCGRLVALVARFGERAAARTGSLPLRLAAWELARTPRRHLVAALLSVAAVAGCGFEAAQHASWQRSAHDQAVFQVGADVGVGLAQAPPMGQQAAFGQESVVRSGTPAYQSVPSQGPAIIGVDAAQAARTVTLRPDQADRPLGQLWSDLTPTAEPGLALPGRPTAIGLTVRLSGSLTDTSVLLMVADATGTIYQLSAGALASDGADHESTLSLTSQDAQLGGGAIDYPLRLVGVSLAYWLPAATQYTATFTVQSVTYQPSESSPYVPLAGAAAAITGWDAAIDWANNPLMVGCTLQANPGSMLQPAVEDQSLNSLGAHTTFTSGTGNAVTPCQLELTAGELGEAIPAVATAAYMNANRLHDGSVVSATVDQVSVRARIVATVSAFPSPTGDESQASQALAFDLGELSDQALLGSDLLAPASTWWLSTAGGVTPPILPTAAVAQNANQLTASMLDDPAAAVPQRMLTLGAVSLGVFALLGLLVSLLSAARDAGARDTVLCALGMGRGQRAALGCILHTAVAAPSALAGAALGFLLARLLVPEFVLSPAAQPPTPAPVVLYSASWSVLALSAVTVCVAAAGYAISARRRDPAAVSRGEG